MRAGISGRVAATALCMLLAASGAEAAPSDTAIDALRDISLRIQTATRETVEAHAAHRGADAATVQATKSLRGRFDAIARRASVDGFAGDGAFSRKARRVGELLANLERAAAAPRDAALPVLIPTVGRKLAITPAAGASCATALTAASGDAIDKTLAPGASFWLRVAAAKTRFVRVDTVPSAVDTEITLFGASCPAGEDGAIARNDDAYGLAAAVAIDTERSPGGHYVRVRNLGRSAGAVVVRVEGSAGIVGRISDARTARPIFAYVTAVTPDGYFLGETTADATTGLYLLAVDAGAYYVLAQSYSGSDFPYLGELYPDAACQSTNIYSLDQCDSASATLLTVADGQQLSGINIALGVGARVAGVVRDAQTGSPLSEAQITVYDAEENPLAFAATDTTGRFQLADLLPGDYFVGASLVGYGSQLWNHVACTGPVEVDCHPADGTPLVLARDSITTDIDFDLPLEAHLRATILPRDGAPIPTTWALSIYEWTGAFVGRFYAYDASTQDSPALAPGNYYAFVTADGYFGQLWNSIDCTGDCGSLFDQATPIAISRGQTASVSFAPMHVPTVSGTITDATTHAPVTDAGVSLLPATADGTPGFAYVDADGHYTIVPQTEGSYYVWVNSLSHRGTVYPDAACPDGSFQHCDTDAATQITIALAGPDATGIDIAMPVDGSASGHVALRAPDGMILAPMIPEYTTVQFSTTFGEYAGSAGVLADGSYELPGLPEGTYYAAVQGSVFMQIYPGIDCDGPACSPLQGSPITVVSGADTGGIDFDPIPRDYLFGRVTDTDGAPIPGIAIDLWQQPGRHCGAAVTNADGYYAATQDVPCQGVPILSTDVGHLPYENQVYDGIPCPLGPVFLGLCSLEGATLVPFPTKPTFSIADFALSARPETIFASGFDP